MKTLYFESVGGASGDMILGALFALGVDPVPLRKALSGLPIDAFELEVGKDKSKGLAGIKATVKIPGHEHHHRGLAAIEKIISESGLSDQTIKLANRVFHRLAEAEAGVHGTTVDEIHFHEVGAIDSIVDIVGSCLALEALGVDEVAFAPLPVGCGTVTCAHGVYPAPAPATVELLKGETLVHTDEPFELVTPTGAALLTTWRTVKELPEKTKLLASGYGLGQRELRDRPNALRASLLETDEASDATGRCLVLESNIDDTTPELMGTLQERLLSAGALDVFLVPIQMKKQRPGLLLTVLCNPGDREVHLDLIFKESTTFGVREYMTHRTMLERRHEEVSTPYGKIRIKIGTRHGQDITFSPEMDDCIQCADKMNVAVREVYESALQATTKLKS